MEIKNLPYYLGFSHCLGIGPVKFDLLISHFKSPETAYKAGIKELEKALGSALAKSFDEFRNEFDPQEKIKEFEEKEIKILTREDDNYPPQFLNIADPPICLYVKGVLPSHSEPREAGRGISFQNNLFIAIVGTRKPTSYGQQITRKFAAQLASAGFVIVSGMAIGIDSIAHQATLDAGGKAIAILGCGVDIVYPPSNEKLYQRIIENGLIISEFPPGMTVLKGLFIARNRLISGLSMGVLVCEGASDSGALVTAKYAAEQGKEVFAPPGPITSEMSAAPNILLKEGAKLVTSVSDIFDELGLKLKPKQKEELQIDLMDDERLVFDLLEHEPKLSDEIVVDLKMPIGEILQILSSLEIKGIIEKNSEGKYQVKL